MAPQIIDLALVADLAQVRSDGAGGEPLNAMAAEASGLEVELAAARDQRRSGKRLAGVAARAVGLQVVFALQVRGNALIPIGLDGVSDQRAGPGLVLAVRIGLFQAVALTVVARGAAKLGEIVFALPMAILVSTGRVGLACAAIVRLH